MAAHKPIVSTPIHDVLQLYGSVVRTAEGAEAFVAAVQAALDESPGERQERECGNVRSWNARHGNASWQTCTLSSSGR